jgi:MFS family permease
VAIARQAFRPALAVAEFRRLWTADVQSYLGDQLARVALSVLVYDRTHSGLITSVVYALTYLPALLGGILLGGLADRFARREVLVGSDLVRALLVASMALPSMPTLLIAVLLGLSVLAGGLFNTTESALVADILTGEVFASGTALRSVTGQVAQLAGFAVGGACVAVFGTRTALLIDAVTFVISAVLIRCGVRARPRARTATATIEAASTEPAPGSLRHTVRVLSTSPRLRRLLVLAWVGGLFVVAEGLAAPFVAQHRGSPTWTGLLLAAAPAGTALGTVAFMRWCPAERRSEWVAPLAFLAALPLTAYPLAGSIPVAFGLLALNGALSAYQVQVIAEYVPAVPPDIRGRAIGIGASGLVAVQGIALLLGGVVAQSASVAVAVSTSGVLAGLVAFYVCVARVRGPDDRLVSSH